jgi:hypothetical protein
MPGLLQSLGGAVAGIGKRAGLPEFGISELLAGTPPPQQLAKAYNQQGVPKAFSQNAGGSVLGTQTGAAGVGASTSQGGFGRATAPRSVAPAQATNPFGDPGQLQSQISQYDTSFMDAINQDYEATLSGLASSEELARQGASGQIGQAEASAAPVRAQIAAEQEARTGALDETRRTGEQNYNKGLEQARQTYSELEQRNQSLAAGTGLSSSSVSQALSERLGRQTAAQLADLSENYGAFTNAIAKEKENTVKYYQTKLTDLESQLAQFKNQIGLELNRQIAAINAARGQAAGQKAQQKAGLAAQARDALQQAFQQSQQYAASLQMWQTQRQAALDDAHSYQQKSIATLDPSAQLQQIQQLNPNLQLQGATIGSNGNPSYKIGLPKGKSSEEDRINALFGGG